MPPLCGPAQFRIRLHDRKDRRLRALAPRPTRRQQGVNRVVEWKRGDQIEEHFAFSCDVELVLPALMGQQRRRLA